MMHKTRKEKYFVVTLSLSPSYISGRRVARTHTHTPTWRLSCHTTSYFYLFAFIRLLCAVDDIYDDTFVSLGPSDGILYTGHSFTEPATTYGRPQFARNRGRPSPEFRKASGQYIATCKWFYRLSYTDPRRIFDDADEREREERE